MGGPCQITEYSIAIPHSFDPTNLSMFFGSQVRTPGESIESQLLTRKAPANTPLKISMEHNHGCLEDHFAF